MKSEVPGRGATRRDIVLVVPVELKSMVKPIERLLKGIADRAAAMGRGRAVDYAEIEGQITARAAAVERAAHKVTLRAMEVDARHILVGASRFNRIGHALGTYNTLAGPVHIRRALYRRAGERNAKVVDAISLRAGVVGRGYLPRTAQAMAHIVQSNTSREAEGIASEMGRLPYARASFERVTHRLGERWLEHHADIEDQLIQGMEIPEAASSVSVSIDRVSVPMEEPAKRPGGRPRKGAARRPVTRQFRMAYCGTVTLHDRSGAGLHTIRYGCMPHEEPLLLCQGMADDVYRLLERRSDLKVTALADGAPELWNLLDKSLDLFVPRRLVDFWHVVEKLAPAARAIHGEAGAATAMRRWIADLRRRKNAAKEILQELLDSGYRQTRVDGKRPVHEAITYLDNHHDQMNYAGARRLGLPIGSGNVEATCKTLFGLRMKRCGARWKPDTAVHIVRLRALALSDRWQPAMALLHARSRTAVRPAA